VLLSDFVRLVEERTGRQAQVTSAPLPSSDVPYTYADISKARRLLDYGPQTCVEDGVSRFWEWYQSAVLAIKLPAQAVPVGA
jgi:UDP-glucuronate 4-epimerase